MVHLRLEVALTRTWMETTTLARLGNMPEKRKKSVHDQRMTFRRESGLYSLLYVHNDVIPTTQAHLLIQSQFSTQNFQNRVNGTVDACFFGANLLTDKRIGSLAAIL